MVGVRGVVLEEVGLRVAPRDWRCMRGASGPQDRRCMSGASGPASRRSAGSMQGSGLAGGGRNLQRHAPPTCDVGVPNVRWTLCHHQPSRALWGSPGRALPMADIDASDASSVQSIKERSSWRQHGFAEAVRHSKMARVYAAYEYLAADRLVTRRAAAARCGTTRAARWDLPRPTPPPPVPARHVPARVLAALPPHRGGLGLAALPPQPQRHRSHKRRVDVNG